MLALLRHEDASMPLCWRSYPHGLAPPSLEEPPCGPSCGALCCNALHCVALQLCCTVYVLQCICVALHLCYQNLHCPTPPQLLLQCISNC